MKKNEFRIMIGLIAVLCALALIYINFFNEQTHEYIVQARGQEAANRSLIFANMFWLSLTGIFSLAFIKFEKL